MPRRSRAGGWDRMSRPPRCIEPELGSTIRLTIRNDVVLPHPDGPTSSVICPCAATRSSPATATIPSPNRLLTPRNSIIPHTNPAAGLAKRGLEESAEVGGGEGAGEKPALIGIHAQVAEQLELGWGLDTFGDADPTHRMCHLD